MNERLATLLRNRYEGRWELLAIAAGNVNAVHKACGMLSRSVLDDFVHPDWMVEERVEALSAFDPTVLASLAEEWPKPVETESPFIRHAWRAGLRHLLPIMQLTKEDFSVPELAEEISVLWSTDPSEPITWEQAFRQVDQKPIFDDILVRRLARRPLVDPLPSLDDLLQSPAWMLPLLRGHVHRLESSVRDYLADCARRCLASDLRSGAFVAYSVHFDVATGTSSRSDTVKYIPLGRVDLEGNATEAPPIIEVCREIDPDLMEDLGNKLADQVPSLRDPRLAAPLAYLLLTGWNLP